MKVRSPAERSADLLFRLYRYLRLKNVGDERPFVSLRRAVEHEALVSLQARDVGVRTPRLARHRRSGFRFHARRVRPRRRRDARDPRRRRGRRRAPAVGVGADRRPPRPPHRAPRPPPVERGRRRVGRAVAGRLRVQRGGGRPTSPRHRRGATARGPGAERRCRARGRQRDRGAGCRPRALVTPPPAAQRAQRLDAQRAATPQGSAQGAATDGRRSVPASTSRSSPRSPASTGGPCSRW